MNYVSLKPLFEQTHIVQLPQINHNTLIEREGNQESAVVIIVKKSDIEVSPNKEMLTKLLQAVKCPLPNDASIMILGENQPIKIHDILSQDSIRKIIIFGISPKHIGIFANIRAYSTIKMGDQQWLFSENLDTIQQQKEKKGILWAALQHFFELK